MSLDELTLIEFDQLGLIRLSCARYPQSVMQMVQNSTSQIEVAIIDERFIFVLAGLSGIGRDHRVLRSNIAFVDDLGRGRESQVVTAQSCNYSRIDLAISST